MREISRELGILRPGSSAIDRIIAPLTELLETEHVLAYSVRDAGDHLELERWNGHANLDSARDSFADALLRPHAVPVILYNFMRPLAHHRDRFVEATKWIERERPGGYLDSRMYREVMKPVGLGSLKQHRALVCDGPALLAWFGVLQSQPVTARQDRLVSSLLPELRRTMALERQLAGEPTSTAMLEVALDALGYPALICDARGRVHAANAAARAITPTRRSELAARVAQFAAGRADHRTEITSIASPGLPSLYLVAPRTEPDNAAYAAAIAAAAARWTLSPRQTEVLELVARGLANATVAAMLGVSERAVEHHVTALLARADVDNRARLVAAVLTATAAPGRR